MRVLIKRIQAVLFRCGEKKEAFLYRGLAIEFARKRVTRGGEEIPLTMKEYRLLEYLARNKGQLLTKNQILEQVWDVDGTFVGENTVSMTVTRCAGRSSRMPRIRCISKMYSDRDMSLGNKTGEYQRFRMADAAIRNRP